MNLGKEMPKKASNTYILGDGHGFNEFQITNAGSLPLVLFLFFSLFSLFINETILFHPVIIEELGHVVSDRIWKENDAALPFF